MLLQVNGALYHPFYMIFVPIQGGETGIERGVDWGEVKKKRGVCVYIRPLQTQGGTYIDKMCKTFVKSENNTCTTSAISCYR